MSALPWLPLMQSLDPLFSRLDRARQQFDQRSRRERLMIIAAAVILCGGLADRLWLTPAFKTWSTAQAHAGQSRIALGQLTQELSQREHTLQSESQQLHAELAQLKAHAREGDLALAQASTGLVPAAQMMSVLEHLLSQTTGVRLRAMQSLPPEALSANPMTPAGETAPPATAGTTGTSANMAGVTPGLALYRHGVTLSVEGSYAPLMAYLRALDAMPQRLLWSSATLKVEQHPRAVLTLQLHTLSLSPGWLEV